MPHDRYRRPAERGHTGSSHRDHRTDRVFPPEPCPPTGVAASVDCQQLSATVSWEESDLALGYRAYLESPSGHRAHCASAGAQTLCEAAQLACGTVYSVWVKALGLQYNSSASRALSLMSGEEEQRQRLMLGELCGLFLRILFLHSKTGICCFQTEILQNEGFFVTLLLRIDH